MALAQSTCSENQRWLVAISKGVHQSGIPRLLRQQRPGQHVGLNIDHYDVAALLERLQRMPDAGSGVAGRLNDHVQARRSNHRQRVTGDMAAAGRIGLFKTAGGILLRRPMHMGERFLGPRHVQIGHGHHMQAARAVGLGQKHGAELASANDANAQRIASIGTSGQEAGEVHHTTIQ